MDNRSMKTNKLKSTYDKKWVRYLRMKEFLKRKTEKIEINIC